MCIFFSTSTVRYAFPQMFLKLDNEELIWVMFMMFNANSVISWRSALYTVGTMSKSNRQMVTTDAKWTTQSWQLTFWLGTERKGSRGHDHMVVESNWFGLCLWCLMPIQLYRGGQLYRWRSLKSFIT
jgi:hypothetical protein